MILYAAASKPVNRPRLVLYSLPGRVGNEGRSPCNSALRESDIIVPSFSEVFLAESLRIISAISPTDIEEVVNRLATVRSDGGRLFILGVGGSAGHASHAVNDFRKICGFEAYAPTDNVSELTARANDEGWETIFVEWLKGSRLRAEDGILVFSVGGGSLEKNVSVNLVRALEHAKRVGATVVGIVGREGGYTAQVADACVVVPPLVSERITPHTEGLAAVVWHLIVSHPAMQQVGTKWESVSSSSGG